MSRGEYILLLDNDDAIIPTALEELYTVAKKFDADVVHCEKYLQVATEENLLGRNDYHLAAYNVKNFVTEPTLISENFFDRVQAFAQLEFMWNVWTKLVRREYYVENNIKMIDTAGQDLIFTSCLVCSAKKYLRVPNVVNIYRLIESSLSHRNETPQSLLKKWLKSFSNGISYVDKFLSEREFFQKNPDAKYLIFDTITRDFVGNYLLGFYEENSAAHLDEFVREELEKIENQTALSAFMFNRMNFFHVQLIKQQQIIQQLQNQLKSLQK